MVATDEDAFICDMMETYHIDDYMSKRCDFIATLAAGLREDSRIRMKISGERITGKMAILSMIYDDVHWLHWAMTEDGQKNRKQPDSLHDRLVGIYKSDDKGILMFESGEDFKKYRRSLLKGGEDRG